MIKKFLLDALLIKESYNPIEEYYYLLQHQNMNAEQWPPVREQ